MALHLVESLDLSVTTDANGYFDYTFTSAFDQVQATPSEPLATGNGINAIVAVAVEVTGAKTIRGRIWVSTGSPDTWSVRPAASEDQHVVQLLTLAH